MSTQFLLRDRWASTTGHVTGLAFMFVSAGMLVSAFVGLVDGSAGSALLGATVITASLGVGLSWTTRPGALDNATVFTAVA